MKWENCRPVAGATKIQTVLVKTSNFPRALDCPRAPSDPSAFAIGAPYIDGRDLCIGGGGGEALLLPAHPDGLFQQRKKMYKFLARGGKKIDVRGTICGSKAEHYHGGGAISYIFCLRFHRWRVRSATFHYTSLEDSNYKCNLPHIVAIYSIWCFIRSYGPYSLEAGS